ncbi:ATP-binding protein [Streptomyces sp. SID14446]|uniref:ATP-binding protein n=1 Tax=Streptomyces sp. SID14446 TaxID=2706072 RepID=UPI0013BC3E5D|nr:ATP-binding protein [Streptomyces sp. SID14446]
MSTSPDSPEADKSVAAPLTAGEARRLVARVLADHYGTDREQSVAAGDALLVASELVTNAIRHGGGVRAFSAHVTHGELLLQVTDNNLELPHAPPRDLSRPGGFGWALVNGASRRLDVRPLPDGSGKTVIAYLGL